MSEAEKKPEGLPPDAIEMTIRRVVCEAHGEPFRAKWPAGYPIAMVRLWECVMNDEGRAAVLWRDARSRLGLPEDAPIPAKAGIEAALDVRALCCRVPIPFMEKVLHEANIGTRERCQVCRKKGMGTPFRTMFGDLDHVCFSCALRNVRKGN